MKQCFDYNRNIGSTAFYMKAALTFLLGLSLSSTFAGSIVSTLDHASLEAAIRGGGLVQITTSGTIVLTNTIQITEDVTIVATASNVVISGGGNWKAFKISGATVKIDNLTISNCRNTTPTETTFSQAYHGGAMSVEQSVLFLVNSRFLNNGVGSEGLIIAEAFGGSIYSHQSQVYITNVNFNNNFAAGHSSFTPPSNIASGGAIYLSSSELFGAQIFAEHNYCKVNSAGERSGFSAGGFLSSAGSKVFLSQSRFSSNNVTAYRTSGGAFWLDQGSEAAINNSYLSGNKAISARERRSAAPAEGGAIANSGSITLRDTVLSRNSAASALKARGGALFNDGTCFFTTSTASKNGAFGDFWFFPFGEDTPGPWSDAEGGAIYSSSTLNITNSTFASNEANAGLLTYYRMMSNWPGIGRGGALYLSGAANLEQTTFVDNRVYEFIYNPEGEPTVISALSPFGSAVFVTNGPLTVLTSIFSSPTPQSVINSNAPVVDLGGNLSSDSSYAFLGGATNVDIKLGQLGYHGGYTPTIPLLADSPAINFGPVAQAKSIDQRHYIRAAGERVDSGAFEFYPPGTAGSTVGTHTFNVQTFHQYSTGAVNFSQGTIAAGALLMLEATPGSNSHFLGWSGSITSQSPQLFLVVTQDLELTASFGNVTETMDPDSDFMADAWETNYFGNAGHNGSGDFDNDSMTDLHEFLAGTNPTNASSRLMILHEPANLREPAPTLSWSAIAGKRYRLQYKNSLLEIQWQDVPGDITAASTGTLNKTDATASGDHRFYRVVVVPQ